MDAAPLQGTRSESECPPQDTHIRTPVSRTDGRSSSPRISTWAGRSRAVPKPEGDPSMRQKSHRLALAAVAVIALLAPATAAAKATPTEISSAKTKGVEYLKGLQKTNGEISGFGGDWALTAFAAAGVAPADVKKTGD